jgi:hypothetical protein
MLAFTASLGRVAWAWAQDPSAAAVKVSALTGGITARAAFHHPGFFDAARRCMTAYSAASNPAQADARQKDCLAIWMRRNGADPQAIAFMRFAPVPAAISEVRNYGPVDVIHAAMLWADASDGWAIVGNPEMYYRSGTRRIWTPILSSRGSSSSIPERRSGATH